MLQMWKRFSLAEWFERVRQVLVLGEFRGGKLVGMDKVGNKYYEVVEEKSMLPCKL